MAGLLDPQPQPYGLLGDIRQYTGLPSRAISGLLDWYQSQPSVADRMASEYQGGLSAMDAAGQGLPERLRALAAYKHSSPETAALAMDFGGMLGTMAGVNAKTANLAKLAEAQDLAKAGAPREAIWDKTGWFQGPDKKWRFEIDDSSVPLKMRLDEDKLLSYPRVADALGHKDLYQAYPDMADTRLAPTMGGSLGTFIPDQNVIALKPITQGDFTPQAYQGQSSTALHELQHAIQQKEGFARGGDPSAPTGSKYGWSPFEEAVLARKSYEKFMKVLDLDFKPWESLPLEEQRRWIDSGRNYGYRNLAGEVESRTVQARKDLTPEQRAARAPWLDYDVPENQMIVRGLLGQ